ncbi:alpha/beta hydrolase [Mangrovimonas xylaniphaga]|uniref:alpha/beta hydrolase n=1 Tax=Mangrovimonas xylaniphaga TaxID=1645915 RepID=UPI0006B4E4A6|nr:esterase [Mangrovimonas xylaniphaga]
MNLSEKEISYTTTNSYATLNQLTERTKNIWFVCHGMGYLSRYFLRHFEHLNTEENYIVAPQAQSKYYIPPKLRHVGASWLTKENTLKETENVMRYFDAVWEAEQFPADKRLIVLGYSQGVSVSMRYLSKRKLQCHELIIHSGGIPKELTPEDFNYMNPSTKVSLLYGTEDEYLTKERMETEINKANLLFPNTLKIISFEGKHVVNTKLISDLI